MAIAFVTNWTAVAAGTTALNSNPSGTQADLLLFANAALTSDFTAGKATPTTLTYAGTAVNDKGYSNSGGAVDALIVRALHLGTHGITGSNNLVLTQQGGAYGGGPVAAYAFLVGVHADIWDDTSIQADDTIGTSVSYTVPTVAGSWALTVNGDFGDTAHTISGTGAVEDYDGAAVNSQSLQCGHTVATGTSHVLGFTGAANIFGMGVELLEAVAAATGGRGPLIAGFRNRLVIA
jgi:hypothetical protein